MDCGIFFMKERESIEVIKGFWYKSLLPASDDSETKIFFFPLHQEYFSRFGVSQEDLKDFKLEIYTLKEESYCIEFKYIFFEHLSNCKKIEDLFFNVIKDFIETFYNSELLEFISIFGKQQYEISTISLMIDNNIRNILDTCFEKNIFSKEDIEAIQYLESRELIEKNFLNKFFKKIFF
jgi:hypothetical protein